MTEVAVVGCGNLGHAVVRRLLNSGFTVAAYDRDTKALANVATHGAHVHGSIASCVHAAEVVFLIVRTEKQTIEVAAEAARSAPVEATIVVGATVAPQTVQNLEAQSPQHYLDVGMAGSAHRAEAGALALFVGGDAAVQRRAGSVLAALGTPIDCGQLGAGMAAKIARNQLYFGVRVAIEGARQLAVSYGIGASAVRSLIRDSYVEDLFNEMVEPMPSQLAAPLGLQIGWKDLQLAAELGEILGLDSRLADTIARHLPMTYGLDQSEPS